MTEIIRVLGIDVGTKKTGIAIGQSITATASPLALLKKDVTSLHIDDFLALINQWKINQIAIGLPIPADGKITKLMREIYRLADEFKKYNLKVEFIDETLTSHEARSTNYKRDEYDSLAAAIIAESFLDNFLKK